MPTSAMFTSTGSLLLAICWGCAVYETDLLQTASGQGGAPPRAGGASAGGRGGESSDERGGSSAMERGGQASSPAGTDSGGASPGGAAAGNGALGGASLAGSASAGGASSPASGDGTDVATPCSDICSPALNIDSTANPGVAGPICYERTAATTGANVGGVVGKGLSINDHAVTTSGNVAPWPAKRHGGYCFSSEAGFSWLSLF